MTNALLLRRRGMMAQGGEILTPIWLGTTIANLPTNGTVTSLGGTDFTITSTGSANWGLAATCSGSNSLFLRLADMIGTRIKFEFDIESINLISSANFAISPGFFSGVGASSTRHAYYDINNTVYPTIGLVGHKEFYFDITPELDGFISPSSAVNTDYFTWRCYLHSNAGSSVTIKNIKGYIVT